MKILKFATYEEMSAAAADILAKQINIKNDSVLGLATGSTPVGMYKKLVEMNKSGLVDFSKIKTVNLDEYYPIDPANKQSYRYFMDDNLFNHVNIDKANTYVPDGAAEDADLACENHEKIIKSLGGIDVQILGIGQNGHIGFNEPGENLYAYTHLARLTESTIEANARFFAADEEVPRAALTMGMASILKARKIVLIATGAAKHRAVKALVDEGISTDVPATLLKVHPGVTVICDKDAYYGNEVKLRIGIDLGGTNIAGGIVDDNGVVTHKMSVPTKQGASCAELAKDMAKLAIELAKSVGKSEGEIDSVGIGCPGFVDGGKGIVRFAGNLGLTDAAIKEEFKKWLDVPVCIENDANAAAYGEYRLHGSESGSFVLITIGTGIGGGIVVNNKIYRGFYGAGAELGHITMYKDGIPCSCGRNGCFEKYASASALIEQTKEAIANNPASLMAKEQSVTGKTAFDAAKAGDAVAKAVVDRYISYLAEGIMDIIMLLRPERIAIGGGIANEGDAFIDRIRKYVVENLKTYDISKTEICAARLLNDAGIVGAAFAAEI